MLDLYFVNHCLLAQLKALQLCYTNHPVVVVGIVCIIVDRC